jgi:hypothetical protein
MQANTITLVLRIREQSIAMEAKIWHPHSKVWDKRHLLHIIKLLEIFLRCQQWLKSLGSSARLSACDVHNTLLLVFEVWWLLDNEEEARFISGGWASVCMSQIHVSAYRELIFLSFGLVLLVISRRLNLSEIIILQLNGDSRYNNTSSQQAFTW